MTETDKSLLKLYKVNYDSLTLDLDSSIHITFHLSLKELGSAELKVLLTDILNVFKNWLETWVGNKSWDWVMRKMTLDNFYEFFRGFNTKAEYVKQNLESWFYDVSDLFRFPYIVSKNTEGVPADMHHFEFGVNATLEHIFRLLRFLVDLYDSGEDYEITKTISCNPQDILFIVNYKLMKSKCVNRLGMFEMGCRHDSAYVRRVFESFECYDIDNNTPFYYCQFSSNAKGDIHIYLTGYASSSSLNTSCYYIDINEKNKGSDVRLLDSIVSPLMPKLRDDISWNKLTARIK